MSAAAVIFYTKEGWRGGMRLGDMHMCGSRRIGRSWRSPANASLEHCPVFLRGVVARHCTLDRSIFCCRIQLDFARKNVLIWHNIVVTDVLITSVCLCWCFYRRRYMDFGKQNQYLDLKIYVLLGHIGQRFELYLTFAVWHKAEDIYKIWFSYCRHKEQLAFRTEGRSNMAFRRMWTGTGSFKDIFLQGTTWNIWKVSACARLFQFSNPWEIMTIKNSEEKLGQFSQLGKTEVSEVET